MYRHGDDPSTPSLVAALSATLRAFEQVWIVLDGIDESRDRQKLLDLLLSFTRGHFPKIRILALSRQEIDIERAFEFTFISLSLSNPLVDEDIKIYIERQLQVSDNFTRWPGSLRDEIAVGLTIGAKGM